MPYRICKTLEIENGHMLSKHPDNCKYPHGHSRKVEFVLAAERLDQNDMVCDFKIIKTAVNDFVMSLDHAICMNTKDAAYADMKARFGDRVIGYENQDPTTEVMAKHIFDTCTRRLVEYATQPQQRYPLAKGVRLISVRLWETSSSWAEYSE